MKFEQRTVEKQITRRERDRLELRREVRVKILGEKGNGVGVCKIPVMMMGVDGEESEGTNFTEDEMLLYASHQGGVIWNL